MRLSALAAALWLAPAAVLAQRPPAPVLPPSAGTERLGSFEPALRLELSFGRETGGGGDPYSTSLTTMVLGAARWADPDGGGVRGWLLYARRDSSANKPRAQFAVLGLSADITATVGRRTSVALSVGMGMAVAVVQPRAPGGYPRQQDEERPSPLLGIALRHRRVAAELHLAVLGGDAYWPLTVGFRF